jgi:hypothetical protein
MLKQFDHMIEPKLNLELSNVFPRLKFLAGCGQFSDFSNNCRRGEVIVWNVHTLLICQNYSRQNF